MSFISILTSILVVIVLTYLIFALMLYFRQPSFLYQPLKDIVYTPQEIDLHFENVTFKSSDGLNLNGWYIPADNAKTTLLFCHGNAGNIMHRIDSIKFFHDLGLNCFIFDYRGFGISQGRPSEQGTYLDASAAFNWLIQKKQITPETIIIFGRSLGGSIAAQLATKVTPKALALESAFTSYIDMGNKLYPYMPIRMFAKYSYNTNQYLKDVRCPLIIIHSRNDEIIPFEFGTKLYETANEPKKFIEIAGNHNDCFIASEKFYKRAWIDWLTSFDDDQQTS